MEHLSRTAMILTLVGNLLLAAESEGGQETGLPTPYDDEAGRASVASPAVEIVHAWFPEEIANGLPSRLPGWLPVYLELKTSHGQSQQVWVEGSVSAQGSVAAEDRVQFSTRKRVEVHPGASKQVWVYLRYESHARSNPTLSARIQLTTGASVIGERSYLIHVFDQDVQPAPVLVSGDHVQPGSEASPWGGALRQWGRDLTRHGKEWGVREEWLPDDPRGYHAIRLLILRNFDEAKLESTQIDTIRDWVYLGGAVIFVPSATGEVFSTRLARLLLPNGSTGQIRAEKDFKPGKLWLAGTGAGQWADDWRDDKVAEGWDGRYLRVDPVEAKARREIFSFADTVVDEVDENLEPDVSQAKRLYHEYGYGEGTVGVLTIDDQTHATQIASPCQPFRQALWSLIIQPLQGFRSSGWHARVAEYQDSALRDALEAGLTRDLGLWFIATLVFVYLLLVGPGLYFFLNKKNRLHWVVWAEPLVVVIFAGLILLTGALSRGVLTQMRTVTLYHYRAGESLVAKDSYLGVFSSDDFRYRIAAVGARSIRPIFSNLRETTTVRMVDSPDRATKNSPAIDDFRLDVWQTGVFGSMDLEPKSGDFHLSLNDDASGFRLRNETDFTISQGFLVGPQRILYPIGQELAPHETVELKLDLSVSFRPQDLKSRRKTAGRQEDGVAAQFFADDPTTRDTLAAVLSSSSRFLRVHHGLRFIGILDRREADFTVSRGASLIHRLDLLLLYDSSLEMPIRVGLSE